MFKFSRRSLKRMKGVDECLVKIAKRAITISKIDFGIPPYGGVRVVSEQFKLFTEGKSKCDGFRKKSKHQSGRALDVYAYVDGTASWHITHMSQIACAMLQASVDLGYPIKWGGLWVSFLDTPHFELR